MTAFSLGKNIVVCRRKCRRNCIYGFALVAKMIAKHFNVCAKKIHVCVTGAALHWASSAGLCMCSSWFYTNTPWWRHTYTRTTNWLADARWRHDISGRVKKECDWCFCCWLHSSAISCMVSHFLPKVTGSDVRCFISVASHTTFTFSVQSLPLTHYVYTLLPLFLWHKVIQQWVACRMAS